MITLSLCLLVNDQAVSAVNCLDSVKDIVDEIIVVGNASGNDLKSICGNVPIRKITLKAMQDRAAALNYSFSFATMDYIMWLDQDEILLETDRQKLVELKENLDYSVDAVTMLHHYMDENDKVTASFVRNRIVKRTDYFQWQSGLNGYLPVKGKVIDTDIAVIWKSEGKKQQNSWFSVYEYRLEKGERLTPHEVYYYADRLLECKLYDKTIEYYRQFLRENDGWIGDKIITCDKLAEIYRQKGDSDTELKYIFKSFEYGIPRAEFLCRLGVIFTERKENENAIYWYKAALSQEKPKDNLGFMKEECWTWLPHLKLAGCYYRTGDYKNAFKHNELALSFKPGDKNLLYNKNSLEVILKKNEPQVPKAVSTIKSRPERPLKIVQVAPDVYPVPPENYGGTEAIIHEITEELVRRGHEVFLYAPKGSKTSAKLIPYQHSGKGNFDKIAEYVLETIPEGVDIIHDHTHISVLGKKDLPIPTICTIHGTINYRVKYPVFVSRRALEVIGGNHGFYVYNGLNLKEYEYCEQKDDYMLYLGRLDKYKGLGYALDVADRTGKQLVIAGPVHDTGYYTKEVEPRIKNNPNIKYIGSVGGKEKQDVLKHASCLLFPTSWEEPFGLVMIEAMACGTPVIAFANGAVPEVLKAFPGLMCRTVEEMAQKVLMSDYPKPGLLREYVMNNFTTENMVDGYLDVYEKVISENQNTNRNMTKISSMNIQTNKQEALRIVQVAPNAFPVPPKDYGGIERVVYDLTEELIRQGHEVYLYAAEGSVSSARIIPYKHKGTDTKAIAEFVKSTLPEKIDLIHDHTHASVMDQCGLTIPVVSTIHDSRKNSAKNPVYLCRKALQNVGLNQGFYAYNGINPNDYEYSEVKDDYMIFMGLLYSHKGINYALDVAEKTGKRLMVAGPIYNMEYYKKEIEPRIKSNANIRYVGSVGGKERQNLLKHARCMLFPTVWEEPFGLVMIEAMACGTPVLAFGNGAVPEVLGGFPELICRNADEMVEKVKKLFFPESKILRGYVENNFSAGKMADNYLEIYKKVLRAIL
jgi:Glycosyltransferase